MRLFLKHIMTHQNQIRHNKPIQKRKLYNLHKINYDNMCIMPKVKKCEKTFALNVDIFRVVYKVEN